MDNNLFIKSQQLLNTDGQICATNTRGYISKHAVPTKHRLHAEKGSSPTSMLLDYQIKSYGIREQEYASDRL